MEENGKLILKKYQIYWEVVENALNEGSMSGYKIAIIETEKILATALADNKIPGKDIDEKVHNIETVLKNGEKFNYARAMYRKIIKEPGFDVSMEDAKEIISGYYRAITDISEVNSKNTGLKRKMRFFYRRYFSKYPGKIKRVVIVVFVFFVLVFLSAETSAGRAISSAIVDFSRFLFYKVFTIIIIAAIILSILIGAFYWWQDKKNN